MTWEFDLGVSATHLVEAAIRAPSSHNTQPWIFRVTPGGLELIADRTRALPVNDPHDRELVMSCGAALFNLRVAAAEEGLGAEVRLRPDAERPDLLATIHLEADAGPHPALAELAPAIPRRRTYRKAFADREVDGEAIDALVSAARGTKGALCASWPTRSSGAVQPSWWQRATPSSGRTRAGAGSWPPGCTRGGRATG